MTLRLNVLRGMLALETAADDWFGRLSHKEQESYKRAHPRSKYADSLPFGTQVPKKQFNKHARMMGAHVPAELGDKAKAWRTHIGNAAAAGTRGERDRHLDHAHALFGAPSGVEAAPAPRPASATPPAITMPGTTKPPKGVRVADNGLELHPTQHPRTWDGDKNQDHHLGYGGRTVSSHSFDIHKNGQKIGSVHSDIVSTHHMIPNSRLSSHTSYHRKYHVKLAKEHQREGTYMHSVYPSLKSAVEHVGQISKGEAAPKVTRRLTDVDHETLA